MKTCNLNIELITPLQINKEVAINEALITIDNLANIVVVDFVTIIPQTFEVGKKYILSEGDNSNQIIYCADPTKGWTIFAPKHFMVVFIKQKNSFYLFDKNWQKIELTQANSVLVPTALNHRELIGVKENYNIQNTQKIQYLYLDDNCELNFDNYNFDQLTLVVKQNYQNTFTITWPGIISWPNKTPPKITQTPNVFDVFKFYSLPQTKHFIGEIVGQNYTY